MRFKTPVHRLLPVLIFVSLALSAWADSVDAHRETIKYRSGVWTFEAYLYRPQGKGPFPAVVWNPGIAGHLNTVSATQFDNLAKLYTREGFVLLVPDRHVDEISRSDYSLDLQKELEGNPTNRPRKRLFYEGYDINARDIGAAIDWLKDRSYVDTGRIALSGWSSGAAASLVVAGQRKDIRALALFSPGIKDWKTYRNIPDLVTDSLNKCTVPVFCIFASDDPSPGPADVLPEQLKAKGGLNRSHTYVHSGYNNQERYALAVNDCDAWGYDVLRFLETVMKD